jgi:probable HAF family extracellular repeat protein
MFHRSTVIFGILLLASSAARPALAAPYYVTDLGVLAGTTGTQSYAMGVNDYGVVAGASLTGKGAGSAAATIYTGGAWVNIGTAFDNLIGSTYGTFATGINDAGQVAAWVRGGTNETSFIYNTSTSQYTSIAAQPGVCNALGNQIGQDTAEPGDYTQASPINTSGQIVGEYGNSAGGTNLFVYGGGSTSVVTTPATNVDTNVTGASGINNNGVVVGNYAVGDNPIPIGFYFNGTEHDISKMTYPEAIVGNTVVGANYDFHSDTGTATYDAMIYTLGASSATNIGTLGYADQTIAYGVSSSGTVVGTGIINSAGAEDAFIYNGGTMSDLNTQIIGPNPFSNVNVAMGISPNGEYIVGDGTVVVSGTNKTLGFLLTPAIPGDANGDGTVDINDLTIVLAHYNQTGQTWADGEFTGDGTVDINDLTIVLAHYGDTVASSAAGNPSAVPEPAGVVLLLCGGLAALAAALRRRKNSLRP